MTPVPEPALTETTSALCLFFVLLVPFAGAGLALINTGLGRTRNAAHSMLAALGVSAIAAGVYFLCGFAWQGYPGRPAHVLIIGGKAWSWIAAEPFLFRGLLLDGSAASLAAWLQMLSVGIAALIPLASGAERWRLGASLASTALLAGWTYPLFAHWVWGGGWLAQLGVNYGLGHGFVDAGGAGVIQAVGGLTALAIAWILGPRRGKFTSEGMPSAIPGHNAVLILSGCWLAWVGWVGLNAAGAILFAGVQSGQAVRIAVNTTLAAAGAGLAAAFLTRVRFGRPDASLTVNGWVGGLVAGSAAGAFIRPAAAAVIGVVAGALVVLAVEWIELHLAIDDPGGAISVHAVGGLWGLLALGVTAHFPDAGPGDSGQWLAQVIGIATLLGLVLPLSYGLNWLLNRFYPQRVTPEAERQGLDLHELGAGAYPEFITPGEEFLQR